MIRKFPRYVSKQLGKLVPAQSLFQIPAPVFHPFYHVVSDEDLPHILNYNYRNVAEFKRELDFYLRHFRPVALAELISNPRTEEKIFHLSFDDGLRECVEVIAPILLEKGIPATFFINPAFIDNRALFHKYKASLILRKMNTSQISGAEKILAENDLLGNNILKATIRQVDVLDKVADLIDLDFADFLQKQRPYLTSNQLAELQNQGFSIGAHSFGHPEFWEITADEQLDEIRKSVDWVSEKVDPPIKTFAFPFSDSGASKSLLKSVKNQKICDATFGTAGLKYDEGDTHYQRYPAEIPGDFELNLKGEFVYFKLRKYIGKATVKH